MYLLLAFALSAGGCASAEPDYEHETKELYAERDGKQIYGVIYVPKGAGEQMPAVIFSHGFAGNYQVGTQYAQELAAHGYVVYCFDFCGGSPGSRSDGSTLEMSIFTERTPGRSPTICWNIWMGTVSDAGSAA